MRQALSFRLGKDFEWMLLFMIVRAVVLNLNEYLDV
jgi:hypothetical protein